MFRVKLKSSISLYRSDSTYRLILKLFLGLLYLFDLANSESQYFYILFQGCYILRDLCRKGNRLIIGFIYFQFPLLYSYNIWLWKTSVTFECTKLLLIKKVRYGWICCIYYYSIFLLPRNEHMLQEFSMS